MMDLESFINIEKSEKRLGNHWPLVGTWIRRKTCMQLAADASAEAVPLLVRAISDKDALVRETALSALRSLKETEAIDAICALWATNRDTAAGAIIAERRYVATKPAEVRVLSALKTNYAELLSQDAQFVPVLLKVIEDSDRAISRGAMGVLRSLSDRNAVDALCRVAIETPDGVAAKICIECRKRPSDPEEACLFLFVTRQLDAYFQEDFEFQNLRAAYDRAGEGVRGHVMEVVRSGDRRCLGFFGRRKPLSECSAPEIELAIESALKHRDWPRLFRAFQEMPLKYGFPLLEYFRKSGWAPEAEDMKILYRNALQESDGQGLPRPEPPKATSPVFERWLAEGRGGDLAKLSEGELVKRLGEATPSEGVEIVAALAAKAGPGTEAARAVQNNAHWLVRLAGYATGLCRIDLAKDAVQDNNYWVSEMVRSVPALELWPIKATPADLEALNAGPREAFTGRLGAVRRVLRLLLAYRVTAPEMEEVVYEAGEFAGEFDKA